MPLWLTWWNGIGSASATITVGVGEGKIDSMTLLLHVLYLLYVGLTRWMRCIEVVDDDENKCGSGRDHPTVWSEFYIHLENMGLGEELSTNIQQWMVNLFHWNDGFKLNWRWQCKNHAVPVPPISPPLSYLIYYYLRSIYIYFLLRRQI